MDPERILQLLAKQMGHDVSDEEIAELQELLQQYPEQHFLVEVLQSIQGEKLHSEPAIGEDDLVRENWFMLSDQLDNLQKPGEDLEDENGIQIRKIPAGIWMRRAAMWIGLILLAGSSFFIWMRSGKKQLYQPVAKIEKVIVPNGAPEMMLLPDSSVVWLNAGSQIHYADNFINKNREVYLDGEAYFSVKHDADHPFIVYAGNIAIRALGTKFNVHAYGEENKIEATLISGKVQVTIDGKPDQKIILMPNEKLTVTNDKFKLPGKPAKALKESSFEVQNIAPISTNVSVPEVAWVQDKLAFQDEAFEVLAKRMERRYNKHIIFKDTLLGNERLTGIFENENIEKALRLLKMTTPFNYKVKGDTVYLKR